MLTCSSEHHCAVCTELRHHLYVASLISSLIEHKHCWWIAITVSWWINKSELFMTLSSCAGLLDYLSLSFCPSCFFWCGSPYLVGARKAEPSLSCSFKSNRQDTAESCLSSPALVCSHFICLHPLSGESAKPVQMQWKDHYTHTAVTHLHVLWTFMFHVHSGAHQGTSLSICGTPHPQAWSLFWTKLVKGPVYVYQLIK